MKKLFPILAAVVGAYLLYIMSSRQKVQAALPAAPEGSSSFPNRWTAVKDT